MNDSQQPWKVVVLYFLLLPTIVIALLALAGAARSEPPSKIIYSAQKAGGSFMALTIPPVKSNYVYHWEERPVYGSYYAAVSRCTPSRGYFLVGSTMQTGTQLVRVAVLKTPGHADDGKKDPGIPLYQQR